MVLNRKKPHNIVAKSEVHHYFVWVNNFSYKSASANIIPQAYTHFYFEPRCIDAYLEQDIDHFWMINAAVNWNP